MLKTIARVAVFGTLALITYRVASVGDLGPMDGVRATLSAKGVFSPELWIRREYALRGEVLKNLAMRYRLEGIGADSVQRLLGPPECYSVQDGWPCYWLDLKGKRYQLFFILDQNSRVRDVDLVAMK